MPGAELSLLLLLLLLFLFSSLPALFLLPTFEFCRCSRGVLLPELLSLALFFLSLEGAAVAAEFNLEEETAPSCDCCL